MPLPPKRDIAGSVVESTRILLVDAAGALRWRMRVDRQSNEQEALVADSSMQAQILWKDKPWDVRNRGCRSANGRSKLHIPKNVDVSEMTGCWDRKVEAKAEVNGFPRTS